MLYGISQKVEEDTLKGSHVGLNFKGLGSVIADGPGSAVKAAHPLLHCGGKVKAVERERHIPALYLTEVQDVVYKPPEDIHVPAGKKQGLFLVILKRTFQDVFQGPGHKESGVRRSWLTLVKKSSFARVFSSS